MNRLELGQGPFRQRRAEILERVLPERCEQWTQLRPAGREDRPDLADQVSDPVEPRSQASDLVHGEPPNVELVGRSAARPAILDTGRRAYPDDLVGGQRRPLVPMPPEPKPGDRPRWTDLREAVNAVLYVPRTGRGWRRLPHEYPPRSAVYNDSRRPPRR